ncbi:MAG TPA: DUF4340 domain-containing protein, partial [Oceanipulchritudo sp.]|nr:DUF4340 domain-containing protein [Oceanipulchritudo sp.]
MRFKLTILLFILNVALFSLIFYIDRVQSTRSLFESSSRLILDPAFVQGLQKIRIVSQQNDTVWEFQHSDEDDWVVNAPVNWKANPYAIHQLVFQLKELSWESRFPIGDLAQAGQSLESYNLAAPPLQIELFNGTASLVLALGAPTEIGNRLYTLSPDGDYVLVIGRGLAEMLQRDMEAFLDHRIFGTGIEGSRVIQIQDRSATNVRVRLERRESGWRFVSPIEAEADGERIQAMIAEWQSLEADSFDNGADQQVEMDTNALRLTFEGLNKRETLILTPLAGEGDSVTTYRAKREAYGAMFTVPAAQVKELRRAQEDLRERRILLRHADDWTSLKVQFGELSTTLQQLENGAWQVLYTDESGELKSQPADREAIEGMKTLLKTLDAVRFVSDAPSETDMIRFGLNTPQRRLTLRKASGATVELLIGGLGVDDERTLLYATTNQSASVFLIRPHVLASLPLNPLYYRERTIRTLPETAVVEKVELIERASGKNLLVSKEGSDPGDLPEYLGRYLRTTRVGQFLNPPFADPFPLSEARKMEWPYLITA